VEREQFDYDAWKHDRTKAFSEELLVCRLYFKEHRRAKEIAGLIDKSESAVRSIIFRARQRQRNKQCENAPFLDSPQSSSVGSE
jgi:hypothetical protein